MSKSRLEQLADKIGVGGIAKAIKAAPAQMWQILNGRRKVPATMAEPIEKHFGIPAEETCPDFTWVRQDGRLYRREKDLTE